MRLQKNSCSSQAIPTASDLSLSTRAQDLISTQLVLKLIVLLTCLLLYIWKIFWPKKKNLILRLALRVTGWVSIELIFNWRKENAATVASPPPSLRSAGVTEARDISDLCPLRFGIQFQQLLLSLNCWTIFTRGSKWRLTERHPGHPGPFPDLADFESLPFH